MMKRGVLKYISIVLAAISLTVVISVSLLLEPAIKIYGYAELDENRLASIKKTLVIYGDDIEPQSPVFYTPLDKLNKHTIDAFLCAEDKRFYDHEGIDYYRIIYAAIKDLCDGSFTQGASTITQQLIKNSHLSNEKSISRKIREIRLSKALERKYSKNEILEMYLNILYFGNGTYGIGNAAANFLNKATEKLSVRESAMLAAIINNPARYNPYSNPSNLNERTNKILASMFKCGKITASEYDTALNQTINLKQPSLNGKYNCFVIRQACEILGCTEEYLMHSNIKIECNCNYTLQKKLSEYLMPYDSPIQIIVIDNKSGKIIAHEAKYKGDPSAIQRSPGSTIKPIVCYAPALEKNIILPITPILDSKTNFDGYSPNNYKDKYYGWVSCDFALKESLNVPAVKLLSYAGLDYAKNIAKDMGINVSEEEGLALALGGMTYGTTLKDLASAYTIFANGGVKSETSYISAIYRDDKLIYSAPKTQKRVLSEETAYFVNEMLGDCIESGTAKRLNADPNVWAAKTGTVGYGEKNSDAYCIAYSSDYTIGVHVMDSTATGGGLPTKLANKLIMSDIICSNRFKTPSSIVKMDINAIEYNTNQKIIAAKKSLPKKDRITASFTLDNLPAPVDERSDYERSSDFFDTDNFTIVDSFFD